MVMLFLILNTDLLLVLCYKYPTLSTIITHDHQSGLLTPMDSYQDVSIHTDNNNITWITIAVESQTNNTCTQNLVRELLHAFTHIDTAITRLIVLKSQHTHSFIDGHDIHSFRQLRHKQTALRMAQAGQHLCAEISALPVPVVALVQGRCIGAGLEIALACDYILGVNTAETQFTLNEFSLGIHPCFGEITKLLHRVGVEKGLEFLFSQATWNVHTAQKRHLLDNHVTASQVNDTIQSLLGRKKKTFPRHDKTSFLNQIKPSFILRHQLKKLALKYSKSPYLLQGAQQAFIEYWVKQNQNQQAGNRLIAEAESFSELLMSQETQNFIHLRLAEQRLSLSTSHIPYRPHQVHIIGTGLPAQEFAIHCAKQGIPCLIFNFKPEQLVQVQQNIEQALQNKYGRNHKCINHIRQNLHYSSSRKTLSMAELLADLTEETLHKKQLLLADLEELVSEKSIILTHCISLDFRELISPLLYQDRVIGLHLYMPIEDMRLVELVQIPNITPIEKFERSIGFMRLINKLPLSTVGGTDFVIARILIVYLFQGMRLHQQGVPHNVIDQAAREFGMTHGPLELADQIGLDLCYALGELAKCVMGLEIPATLTQKYKLGKYGMKTNSGFYRYRYGRRLKPERAQWSGDFELMKKKLVKQMVEEAHSCLELDAFEEAHLLDVLDACTVWGVGFPEFRGGAIRYASQH